MKTRTLCTLLCIVWCTVTVFAQTPGVLPKDSLALVAIHNTFDNGSANLVWLNGPIEDWGTTDDEIVLGYINDDPQLRVIGLNLSGKALTGRLDDAINDLDALNTLNLYKNGLTALPASLSLENLSFLDISSNRLTEIPNFENQSTLDTFICRSNEIRNIMSIENLEDLDFLDFRSNLVDSLPNFGNMESLRYVNCRQNKLRFKDIIPVINLFSTFLYAPQKNISFLDYYYLSGNTDTIRVYDAAVPHPANVYEWIKNQGAIVSNLPGLIFNNITQADAGNYQLRVTNPIAPNLVINAPISVTVYDSLAEVPFDPFSLIASGDDFLNPEIIDTSNVKRCDCSDDEIPVGLLQNISGLIELNTIRQGATSEVEKDTFDFKYDFNFKLLQDPNPAAFSCGTFSTRSTNTPPVQDKNVKVAIVGAGIAPHTALRSQLYNLSSIPAEAPGCLNPGQVAWDFVKNSQTITVNNPHETHIAGIIAKDFPGDINLQLIDLKIFEEEGYLYDLVCAIHFAIKAKADVINLSLGYYDDTPCAPLYHALEKAEQEGITIVISAGNDTTNNAFRQRWPGNFAKINQDDTQHYPSLSNLIVVAALDLTQDSIATYSNFGQSEVHIAAPGTGIVSTVIDVIDGQPKSTYTAFTGTSMAAGEVSRVAAILKAYAPNLTPQEIIDIIIDSGEEIEVNGRHLKNNRKIDLLEALDALGLANGQEIIDQLDINSVPDVTNALPRFIAIRQQRSLREIRIPLNNTDSIYRKVRFTVKHIGSGHSAPNANIPIFDKTCYMGNVIFWNGQLDDGEFIDRSYGLYQGEIYINDKQISTPANRL
jgi:subtilisin family serine protease